MVDISADAGTGLGIFEQLHGFASAEALSRHLKAAAGDFYGIAARSFLRIVVSDAVSVQSAVKEHSHNFIERYVPEGTDGQVYRVAQRFALIAAAGELQPLPNFFPGQQAKQLRHLPASTTTGSRPEEASVPQKSAQVSPRFAPSCWHMGCRASRQLGKTTAQRCS